MIRLIIFDLGKVILDFSHFEIAEGLSRYSKDKRYQGPGNMMEDMFLNGTGVIARYDEGKMTSEEFFSSIKEIFDLNISFLQFKRIWTEIFTENKGVSDLIERLKKDFPLFLLSNTNELHFNYIKERFPLVHKFDRWVLSYETGLSKPDPEIYRLALSQAGVKAEEAIFIDDISGHVRGAQSVGIHAVEFIDFRISNAI
ncbi:MAG: HAD family phosphatase [Nitrospirae bacterium]|nr:HAD family phosphatase [Nitrospirota bacterium]